MSWALERLGLNEDADLRAVKRAYAALLKNTRPADDPEGFQRLREAYEAALDEVAQRDWELSQQEHGSGASEPGAEAEPPPAATVELPQPTEQPVIAASVESALSQEGSAPSAPDTQPSMTPYQVACMVLEQAAAHHSPVAVHQWLIEQPYLWVLDIKHAVAEALPWALNNMEMPLFADNLDQVWRFFDLDQVTNGNHVDRTYAYQQKRHELSLRWLQVKDNQKWLTRTENQARVSAVWAPGVLGNTYASTRLGRHLGWVSKPRSFWRNVLCAVWWRQVRDMTHLLVWLSFDGQRSLVPPLNADQIHFWLRAGDGARISKERLAVLFGQYVLMVLVLALLLLGVFFALGEWTDTESAVGIGLGMTCFYVQLGRALWPPLVTWQSLPEEAVNRRAWLHVLFVPLLAFLGALLFSLQQTPYLAIVVWLSGYWVMLQRFRGRQGLRWDPAFFGWGIWIVLGLGFKYVGGVLMNVGYGLGVALLVLWAFELYKSRPLAVQRTRVVP